jgi:hypothetical protein
VASSSRPGVEHRVNGLCPCEDAHYRAKDGLCKHRISVYLARRTLQLMQQPAAPVVPEIVEPWPDNDFESEGAPATTPPQPTAPAPLPEAPVSITLKATFDGQEVLVTLRGHDFASVQVQVEQASAWLKAHAPVQASSTAAGWCRKHGLQMTQTTKDGRSWWSHKTAEGWCKGK